MNPNTGHIARFDSFEEARANGYTVAIDTPKTFPDSFIGQPAMAETAMVSPHRCHAVPRIVAPRAPRPVNRFKQRPRVSR